MYKGLEETIKSFKEGIDCNKDYGREFYSSLKANMPYGPDDQILRIKAILRLLKEADILKIRNAVQERSDLGLKLHSLTGFTYRWMYHEDEAEDFIKRLKKGVESVDIFHNEGIMNHFSAHLFGSQGTSILYDLFNSDKWDEINTPYFIRLQEEARNILSSSKHIEADILNSDKIFKTRRNIAYTGIYDPSWKLCVEEVLDHSHPFYGDWQFYVGQVKKDVPNKVIPISVYRKVKPHGIIKIHDLIDDPKIKEACGTGDMQRYFLNHDVLKKIHEIAYLIKESERFEELEELGQAMVGIYKKVNQILIGIRKLTMGK